MPGVNISNLQHVVKTQQSADKTNTEIKAFDKKAVTRSYKKRVNKLKKFFVKNGFVLANFTLIVFVTALVWGGHNNASNSIPLLNQVEVNDTKSSAPLDTLSSADIAANIAQAVSMPEAIAVSNQADSYSAKLATASTDNAIVAKPQLVEGAAESRLDIIKHIAKNGDTVNSLAKQYGVTSDSIKWSNDLTGNDIPIGKAVYIPPSNGIVYLVNSSDSINSIASRFSANKAELVVVNDIETGGLPVGQRIFIPGGEQQEAAAASSYSTTARSSSTVYGFVARYGGNGYVPGYCTYYAASRVSIPSNWGNANTWDNYARASGWTVSSRPVPGAIFQTDIGWAGHVGIVEAVSPDGTKVKVSDMNGFAGFGAVGYSGWLPASTYPNYIYR
jgi:surface antigen